MINLKRVRLAAIDSSGFEAHRVSVYFVRRRAKNGQNTGQWQTTTYRRFPKLAVICDCDSHLILSAIVERGPKPDFDHWIPAMGKAAVLVQIDALLADAGYDAEWVHLAARVAFATRTIIRSTHGRPSDKLPIRWYRRHMATHIIRPRYSQRSQVEKMLSMLKPRLGSAVNAYRLWSQR